MFQVSGSASSQEAAAVTSHDVTLPASIIAGELIVIVFCIAHSGDEVDTTPSGYVESDVIGAGNLTIYVYTKTAGASEPGTVTFGTSSSVKSSHFAMRFEDSVFGGSASVGSGANTSPAHGFLAAPSEDAIYCSFAAWEGTSALSAYPTDYPNARNSESNTDCNGASSVSDVESSTVTQTYSLASSSDWVAGGFYVTESPSGGGVAAPVESRDTSSGFGSVGRQAAGQIIEGADTAVIVASIQPPITSSVLERVDQVAGVGYVSLVNGAAIRESRDTLGVSGSSPPGGSVNVTAGRSTLASTGIVANPVSGSLAATERRDTATGSELEACECNRRHPRSCCCKDCQVGDEPQVSCEWNGSAFVWSVENAQTAEYTYSGLIEPVIIELVNGGASGTVDVSTLDPGLAAIGISFVLTANNECGSASCEDSCLVARCAIWIEYGLYSMSVNWAISGSDLDGITIQGVATNDTDGSIVVPYGPLVEEVYTVSVSTDCGIDRSCSTSPTCCAFHNSLVLELSGLSSSYYHECESIVVGTFGTTRSFSSITVDGMDAFNGLFAFPLRYPCLVDGEIFVDHSVSFTWYQEEEYTLFSDGIKRGFWNQLKVNAASPTKLVFVSSGGPHSELALPDLFAYGTWESSSGGDLGESNSSGICEQIAGVYHPENCNYGIPSPLSEVTAVNTPLKADGLYGDFSCALSDPNRVWQCQVSIYPWTNCSSAVFPVEARFYYDAL